jgi:aminoglycoside 3-N-acetyltransferase
LSDMATHPSKTQPSSALVNYRSLVRALRELRIEAGKPVIVHSSLSAFGTVQGGASVVVGALLDMFESVMAPTFTYKTLVVPETGPPNNAVQYGTHTDRNKMAEFFYPDMPADRLMGIIAETLRRHPDAYRSGHPVLSFAGVNVRKYLEKQMLNEPFAPLAAMVDHGGWVLLMGVDQTSNTCIHLGERLAGRKTYTRWALMSDMVVSCGNFPFCSDGFNSIQPLMEPFIKKVQIGTALVQAVPMVELVETTRQLIQTDPTALLCSRTDCQSCNTIRSDVFNARLRK